MAARCCLLDRVRYHRGVGPKSPFFLIFMAALLCLLPQAAESRQGVDDELSSAFNTPQEEARALRLQRRAAAAPVELVGSFYAVDAGRESTVYLMNGVDHSLAIDLAVRNREGLRLALGRFQVGANRHISLSLQNLLRGQEEGFLQGRVEISYLGDTGSLQAWLVFKDGEQLAELPLVPAGSIQGGRRFSTFWGSLGVAGLQPEIFLTNTGTDSLSYRTLLSAEVTEGRTRTDRGQIPPGATVVVRPGREPSMQGGILWVEHDGQPGQLAAAALLSGKNFLARLPWLPDDGMPCGETTHYTSRLPLSAPMAQRLDDRVLVVLRNDAAEARKVDLHIMGEGSSASVASRSVRAAGMRVTVVDLTGLARSAQTTTGPVDLRLVAQAEGPVAISGFVQHASGEVAELAFFGASQAHRSGTYPIPAISDYEVVTTLVNLSPKAVRIVAQLYWANGDGDETYAFGPVRAPAGATLNLHLDDLVAAAEPDLLGRRPDARLQWGTLRWLAQDADAQEEGPSPGGE